MTLANLLQDLDGDPEPDVWTHEIPSYVASVNKAYLQARGWTRAMIREYLGEPERRLSRWGEQRGRSECRYDAARVRAAEDLPEVIELLAGRAWLYRNRVVKRKSQPSKPKVSRIGKEDLRTIPGFSELSTRDRRILGMVLCKRWRQRLVARKLGISQQTVSRVKRRFVRHISRKSKSQLKT